MPEDGVAPAVGEVWTDDTYRMAPEQFRGAVVVDIGGNVGAFSVLVSKLGAARVFTYEPHPENFKALVGNLELNGVRNVEVHEAAVGSVAGTAALRGDGGGASLTPGLTEEGTHAVTVETIAAVLEQAGDVALLKIDTEGAELDIVGAMGEPEFARVRRIVAEFHGPVMPHLASLNLDGHHVERWSAMVAKLANYGRLHIEGRPMAGGLLWWDRY